MKCEHLHQPATSFTYGSVKLDSEMGSPVSTCGPGTGMYNLAPEKDIPLCVKSDPDLCAVRWSYYRVAETSPSKRDIARLGVYDNVFPLTLARDYEVPSVVIAPFLHNPPLTEPAPS